MAGGFAAPAPGRIVLASGNAGKLREIGSLLAPRGIELVAQSALGVTEAEEPHPSFVENALAKARHASAFTGLPALADDSGLCVEALGGAPGVRSARFAASLSVTSGGEGWAALSTDQANSQALLDALLGKADRRARFHCVLVLLRSPDDPCPIIAQGSWHGWIAEQPRGVSGFGYDPLFQVDEQGATAAELPLARKNAISHRGIALRSLLAALDAVN